MNQITRYLLFFALMLLILSGWQFIMMRFYPPPPHPPGVAKNMQEDGGTAAPGAVQPGATGQVGAATPPPSAAPAAPAPAEPEEAPGKNVAIDTPLWTAEISLRGGGLASFILKGPKMEARSTGSSHEGVNLATPDFGQPLPLSTEVPIGTDFGVDAVYKVVSRGENELVLNRTRRGVTVTRRLSWHADSYGLRLDVRVDGAPPGTLATKTYYTTYQPPEPEHPWFVPKPRPEPHQAVCYNRGERSVERRSPTDKKPVETVPGTPEFAGIDEKYFLAAMAPGTDPAVTSCAIGSPGHEGSVIIGQVNAILQRDVAVTAGTSATTGFDLYLGPKEMDRLSAADHSFDKSVDLGFFGIIGRFIILPFLKAFHAFARNWGVAIILLTVVVKIATLPLTHHQMKSMEDMRKLNPEVEKIKKKYAGDQQRIGLETQKLYKEKGVQPLAGCVPMLIQLPIWYALYATLSASFELYREPFIHGWIDDLTAIDPYYILPILMTVTMILTTVLTPQAAPQPPEMKTVTYVMPIMFGFFMLTLPSGLVLYIFTNNLLSIGQSLWFRRKFQVPPPSATPA
jgi:YidC/Oxa1 family membrane protein insertase